MKDSITASAKQSRLPDVSTSAIRGELADLWKDLAGKQTDGQILWVFNESISDAAIELLPERQYGSPLSKYIVGGYCQPNRKLVVIRLAQGMADYTAHWSTEQKPVGWDKFVDRFASIYSHEITHQNQDKALSDRRPRTQLKGYGKDVNFTTAEGVIAYLSDPQEIGAFARGAVEELRSSNWSDKLILRALRDRNLWKYMRPLSKSFTCYMDLMKKPGTEQVLRRFIENVVRVLDGKDEPISAKEKADVEAFTETYSKAAQHESKTATKKCTCGHTWDEHGHMGDFGCKHESDGCGCLGWDDGNGLDSKTGKLAAGTKEQQAKFEEFKASLHFPLTLYRAFGCPPEEINFDALGPCWSTDEEHGVTAGDKGVTPTIVRAEINHEDDIDWDECLLQNIRYGFSEAEVNVRPGSSIRVTGIQYLPQNQWQEPTPEQRYVTAAKKGVKISIERRGGSFTLTAMMGDAQVGVMHVGVSPASAYIQSVDVEEDYQRQGIATKLYEACKRELKNRGIKTLKGALEGSGTVQLREKVFGPGNTRYNQGGGDPLPADKAQHVMDVEYGRLLAESRVAHTGAKKPITETPAFKAWFAGSKIVNADGTPRIMYHGSRERFSKVDMSQGAQGIFWLASDPEQITNGAAGANSSKTILRCYVSMKNPAGWDEYEKLMLGQIKRDWDGVILPNGDDSFDAFVFKPNQVKILPEDVKTAAAPETSATSTPAFKAWFGQSKIVDSEGNPLVVHHGTEAEFDTFDRDETRSGPSKFGFWFAQDKDFAELFGSKQMATYLKIERPYKISSGRWNSIRDAHAKDTAWFERWRDKLIAAGHDGLIVEGEKFTSSKGIQLDDPSVFAVFEANQIKSVSNSGNFDPAKDSIVASKTAKLLTRQAATPTPDVSDVAEAIDRAYAEIKARKAEGTSAFGLFWGELQEAGIRMEGSGTPPTGPGLADYVTSGYFNPDSRWACKITLEYANGFKEAIASKQSPEELQALKNIILILVTHERVHAYQNGQMLSEPGMGAGKAYGIREQEQSLPYLARPSEIGAYAVHAIFELRKSGMSDDEILGKLRGYKQESTRQELGKRSVVFQKYSNMDAYIDKKRNNPGDVDKEYLNRAIFREFVQKMVQQLQQPAAKAAKLLTRRASSVLYHGTTLQNAELIRTEGILPGNDDLAYATDSLRDAKDYAKTQLRSESGMFNDDEDAEYAVVVIDNTKARLEGIAGTTYYAPEQGETIPADAIVRIDVYDARDGVLSRQAAPRSKYRSAPEPADPQTQTAEFKAWFKNSKVADLDGKPLLVHHGSPDMRWLKEHGVFQSHKERYSEALTPEGKASEENVENAFWFAGDRATALSYADDSRAFDYQNAEPGVASFYLSMQNPFIVDEKGARWSGKTRVSITEAKAAGCDGIIVKNVIDTYNVTGNKSTTTYAVFNANQIKAAKGNNGDFDPEKKSVHASAASDSLFVNDEVGNIKVHIEENGDQVEFDLWKFNAKTGKNTHVGSLAITDWGDDTAGVFKAAIEPAFQGKGIGRAIYLYVAEYLKGHGFTSFSSDPTQMTDGAIGLWESLSRTHDVAENEEDNAPRYTMKLAKEAIDYKPILTELMSVLPEGLAVPEIQIVDFPNKYWLGQETFTPGDSNTMIELQKSVLYDDNTLRRVLAHELAHHADDLLNGNTILKEQGPKAYKAWRKANDPGGHGPSWLKVAALFNAKFGADFVTPKSDASYVRRYEEVAPFFVKMHKMRDGGFVWQHAKKMTPQLRKFMQRLMADNDDSDLQAVDRYGVAKLFQVTDSYFMKSPVIGAFPQAEPATPEETEKAEKLWNEGTDVLRQAASGKTAAQGVNESVTFEVTDIFLGPKFL
jgi:GNAT superfamily N-acetyltransferase